MIQQLEYSIPSSHTSKELTFDITFNDTIKNQPLVIFLHGFKGFKDWGHFNLIAKEFANNGIAFLKLNFSHNGTNSDNLIDFVDLEAFGNNNFSKEIQDLDDLLHFLSVTPNKFSSINFNNTTLMGHSKGGATALIKGMEDNRIHKIITWNGVIYLKDRYAAELKEWKEKGVLLIENARTNQQMPIYYQLAEDVLKNIDRFDIPSKLKTTEKPTLAIHSKEDLTVSANEPISVQNDFTKLELFEEGSHSFDGAHPYTEKTLPAISKKAIELSQRFIKEH